MDQVYKEILENRQMIFNLILILYAKKIITFEEAEAIKSILNKKEEGGK